MVVAVVVAAAIVLAMHGGAVTRSVGCNAMRNVTRNGSMSHDTQGHSPRPQQCANGAQHYHRGCPAASLMIAIMAETRVDASGG